MIINNMHAALLWTGDANTGDTLLNSDTHWRVFYDAMLRTQHSNGEACRLPAYESRPKGKLPSLGWTSVR